MATGEELALRKAKSHTNLGTAAAHSGRVSSNSSYSKKSGSGLMGRVLSMVGRKHGKSENKDGSDTSLQGPGPFERASFIEVVDTDVDDVDLDLEEGGEEDADADADADAPDSLDEEFKELQKKEIEFRSKYQKKVHMKELEQKEKQLTEQLKQLELREIQLKGEKLKGQLKELQIKELKLKEKHLKEEREKELEEKQHQRERQLRLDKSLPEITPQRSPNLTQNVNLDKSLPNISPEPEQEVGKNDFEFEFGVIGDRGSGGSGGSRGSGSSGSDEKGSVTPPLSRSPLNRDKSLPKIIPIDLLKSGSGSPVPFAFNGTSSPNTKNVNKSLPEIKDIPVLDKSLPDIRSSTNSIESIQEVDEEQEGISDPKISLPEPRLDFITPSSSILNRSGNGNSFSNNNSLEDLPEPQIYDTPNQSLSSVHTERPSNESNETLQTCASHIKFDLYQTSSRISSDSKNVKNSSESHNSEQTLRNNSSSSAKSTGLSQKSLNDKVINESKVAEHKASNGGSSKLKDSEKEINGTDSQQEDAFSSVSTLDTKSRPTTSSRNSFTSEASSSKAKKKENRMATVKHAMDKKSNKTHSTVKIKIYNKIHEDDEVIAMKVSKDKIEDVEYLINVIIRKITGVEGAVAASDSDNIKLSLVSKSTRSNSVKLTPENGTRLSSGLIMDYIYSKDKIYVQAERQQS
ncbi:hypothetical protein CLIB1423_01S02894 [[Candida] railenensis]|uniref:Uncharacterized protein n=1 Tax=[Candida] railenensis TaxID=45579 RepID=A0A9P0QJ79_9ASCO|nr:hypothetical protein CLIB1423_01S02894 [[Candida] railenensis]